MQIINDVFNAYQREGFGGRRRPKCRLIPPGARLVRV